MSTDRGRTWPLESETIIYQAGVTSQTWRKKTMQDSWAEMGEFSGKGGEAKTGRGSGQALPMRLRSIQFTGLVPCPETTMPSS